jgi:hypothetical protein
MTSEEDAKQPLPLAYRITLLWLGYTLWATLAGWGLSLLGHVDGSGYIRCMPILVLLCCCLWRKTGPWVPVLPNKPRVLRKPAALAWLVIAVLAGVAGALHAPANYDALSYRLPRILNWWQEGHWYWIGAVNGRMDYSGTGMEWQMLPLIVLTKSDRWLFLLNWLPFLLLPSLAYGAFTGLGMRRKLAATWMWIFPCAYGLALQCGSLGNDGLGAVLVTASLALASRARLDRAILLLGMSAVAAAAATALKGSSLPLLLPLGVFWCLAAFRTLAARNWPLVLPWLAVAACCSFLPVAALNQLHAGDWAGDAHDTDQLRIRKPLAGIAGNSVNLALSTVELPLLPISKSLNAKLDAWEGTSPFIGFVKQGFPRFNPSIGGEIPSEEGAGVGIGLGILTLWTLIRSRPSRIRHGSTRIPYVGHIMAAATAVAVTAYMMKMGSECTARIMLPYLPLCLAMVLLPSGGHNPFKGRWGRLWACVPACCILPALLLTPNRPLVPGAMLAELNWLPQSLRTRIAAVYSTYQNRSDVLAPVRQLLPAACPAVGFGGDGGHTPVALYRPYGTRKVLEITTRDPVPAPVLVVTARGIQDRLGVTLADFVASHGLEVSAEVEVISTVSTGAERWSVLTRKK